jgi:hypothetical protein
MLSPKEQEKRMASICQGPVSTARARLKLPGCHSGIKEDLRRYSQLECERE